MPRLLDTGSRTDAVLAAARALILGAGVRALTLRALARESRVSAASLIHHFSSLERLERVLARRFGHEWAYRQALASRVRGLSALVPCDDEETDDARVWLGWCELARGRPSVAPAVAGVRDDQRRLVAALLRDAGHARDEVQTDLALAMVEGLAAACCAPADPLAPERAAAALDRFLTLLDAGPRQPDA